MCSEAARLFALRKDLRWDLADPFRWMDELLTQPKHLKVEKAVVWKV